MLVYYAPLSTNHGELLRHLGLVAMGGNYATVRRRIELLAVDISHFTGNKGKPYCVRPERALADMLVAGTPCQSDRLRKRLIREGFFEHACYTCGNREWQGQPIPLELEHINGDHDDNRLENLTVLCPNCHAQTSTYRGRKKKG